MIEIADLIAGMKKMEVTGLEINSSGNISVRLNNGYFAIKPTGYAYSEITKENISIIDANGNSISGAHPSSDMKAHLEIYNRRKEINCIIHTHSHYATVFAVLGRPIDVLSTMMADYFGKPVTCLPYVNHRKENFGVLIGASTDKNFLIGSHGVVILGDNIDSTVRRAIALEEAAKINFHSLILANSTKSPITPLSETDREIIHDYYSTVYSKKS
jgi:L-ribulose-5-phosphate 4-epimerase